MKLNYATTAILLSILGYSYSTAATNEVQTERKTSKTQHAEKLHVPHIPAESRIVGGDDADIDEYPFFVSWSGCGASLIARDMLLSAAHCKDQFSDGVIINESRKFGSQGRGISRTIGERIPHPSYNGYSINYDYLLMKLDSPVLDADIVPIELNQEDNVPMDDQTLTVIGFGTLSSGGSTPSTLQEVDVEFVDTEICNRWNSYNGDVIDETMFCAGVDGGGKDSCQGDSGGPIFYQKDDGSYSQVGIVSWGQGCANARYPGVYARVSGVFDWIQEEVCSRSEYPPDFCGGSTPVPPPASSPTNPAPPQGGGDLITVRVEITFDNYPTETSWYMEQEDAMFSGNGSNGFGGNTYSWTMDLSPGEATFVIEDSANDGICCFYGNGSYEIYADETDELLASGDGRFNSRDEINFIVPSSNPTPSSNPIPSPTASPLPGPTPTTNVCQDSLETFLINSEVGEKDCDWLSINMGYFGYLCTFLEVAAKCKSTCESCSYFIQ